MSESSPKCRQCKDGRVAPWHDGVQWCEQYCMEIDGSVFAVWLWFWWKYGHHDWWWWWLTWSHVTDRDRVLLLFHSFRTYTCLSFSHVWHWLLLLFSIFTLFLYMHNRLTLSGLCPFAIRYVIFTLDGDLNNVILLAMLLLIILPCKNSCTCCCPWEYRCRFCELIS